MEGLVSVDVVHVDVNHPLVCHRTSFRDYHSWEGKANAEFENESFLWKEEVAESPKKKVIDFVSVTDGDERCFGLEPQSCKRWYKCTALKPQTKEDVVVSFSHSFRG